MIVARTFNTDREMILWLTNPANIDKLKEEYPQAKYTAKMNIIDKQVDVELRNPNREE